LGTTEAETEKTSTSKPLVTIVVPTYNEAENIGRLIREITKSMENSGYKDNFEILVVDDDSPDGTCLEVRRLAEKDRRIRCLLRRNKKGLATAILRGIHWARGEYVVVMDADFQHPPEVVPKLVETAIRTGADIVVASRYTRGGGVSGWSRLRLLMSKTAILIARILVPGARSTSDPMSGFFLVRKSVVEEEKLNPRGYKILMEMLEKLSYSKVVDVPYVFRNRLAGKSKLGARTIIDFLIHALQLSPMTRFATIGLLGALANLIVMSLLLILGVNKYLASLAGIEAGILFNFVFHEAWTFKTKLKGNWKERLVKYHLASAGGTSTTFLTMALLTSLAGFSAVAAQAAGIAAGFALNYALSLTKIWSRKVRATVKTGRV